MGELLNYLGGLAIDVYGFGWRYTLRIENILFFLLSSNTDLSNKYWSIYKFDM